MGSNESVNRLNSIGGTMKKNYLGLDILRGLGIFIVIWMHSAFYYFDGLYDLDLNNPPLIVTIIGLLLMFAGVFAMISGTVHTIQAYRKKELHNNSPQKILKYNTVSGFLILTVAYMYFIFTGPGLVDMEHGMMNNSIFVELIRNGRFTAFNLERILYIDSLVMIGMNIILLGIVFFFVQKLSDRFKRLDNASLFLFFGLLFFVVSIARIPLYEVYANALLNEEYTKVYLLNWLVNKNNPIMPYLSFALLGAWLAALLHQYNWSKVLKHTIPVALILFLTGVVMYIKLPDNMLERGIDLKWFAIMMAQLGLFLIMILFVLKLFDIKKDKSNEKLSIVSSFLRRFGIAGLTPFFFESIISAIVFRILTIFMPKLSFSLSGSLLYGFCLAISWGLFLIFWEKKQYAYGIEYFYSKIMNHFGTTAKFDKMRGDQSDSRY